MIERADSSLGDVAGPDGSSEAKMLFTVLQKEEKKQTGKQCKIVRSTTTVTNCSQRRKTPDEKRRKWPTEPSTKGKLNVPRNHMIDVASH